MNMPGGVGMPLDSSLFRVRARMSPGSRSTSMEALDANPGSLIEAGVDNVTIVRQ